MTFTLLISTTVCHILKFGPNTFPNTRPPWMAFAAPAGPLSVCSQCPRAKSRPCLGGGSIQSQAHALNSFGFCHFLVNLASNSVQDPTQSEGVSPNNFRTLEHCESYCRDSMPSSSSPSTPFIPRPLQPVAGVLHNFNGISVPPFWMNSRLAIVPVKVAFVHPKMHAHKLAHRSNAVQPLVKWSNCMYLLVQQVYVRLPVVALCLLVCSLPRRLLTRAHQLRAPRQSHDFTTM